MRSFIFIICCLAMVCCYGCASEPSEEAALPQVPVERVAEGTAIRVGTISYSVKEEVEEFQPFADYLAARLKAHEIGRGQVVVVQSLKEMAAWLKRGEVDLYIDSVFPIAVMMELAGVEPMLLRWKRGQRDYHTVIFTHRDSGVKTLAGLKGKMIAFDDPFSTSGYLLPKATLLEAGLKLEAYDGFISKVREDAVGYAFTRDDENTLFWVLKKRTTAGAVDNISFEGIAGKRAEELKVLQRSITVPRQVLAYRKGLDPKLVEALKGILLEMHQDDTGRAVLQDFQQTTKFEVFSEGQEGVLKPIRALMRFIEKDMGKDSVSGRIPG